MKRSIMTSLLPFALVAILGAGLLTNCTSGESKQASTSSDDSSLAVEKARTQRLLTRFDSLDFDVYSHQKWDQIGLSHADNILVHYPDGHTTTGIHDHVAELKQVFLFAPDTKITRHPVKFGIDNWTSVIGDVEGTFSRPMKMPDGRVIQPTDKKFTYQMCTVGHWKNGKMTEEYLFSDNQTFMKQIGLGQ